MGSFTIKLNTGDVKLALTEKYESTDYTTYLMVNELPAFDLNEYTSFLNDAKFDNESTSYEDDGVDKDPQTGELNVIYYFKYTFFLKNVGTVPAYYTMTFNITDNIKPTNVTYGYDDILRVKFYKNDAATDEHESETYAKRIRSGENQYVDDRGNPIYSELKYQEEGTPGFYGYCTNFENDTRIFTISNDDKAFMPGETRRLTVVTWLDGNDSQAIKNAPQGGSLKLGLNINATEYFED